MNVNRPIAVFDSGLGGISVLRELLRELPGEDYLYFGDTANAPYGIKTKEQVKKLTFAAAEKLLAKDPKALVIACNTATSAAITDLRAAYPDKIIVGIEPALKPAIEKNPTGTVGVMATPLTLREEKFQSLSANFPEMDILSIPAPGLVELIEDGADEKTLESFLSPLLTPYKNKLNVMVLGCTHYPFAARIIEKLTNAPTLDGGAGTARQTARRLKEAGSLGGGSGKIVWHFSGGDAQITRAKELLL